MIAATSSAQSVAVGVVLGLERRLGHAVTAEVVGDEPELVGERALVLLRPAEVVLRPAVDEQDRRPVRLAPLAHVQPQAAAAPHLVNLHPPGPLARPVPSLSSLASSARRVDAIVAAEGLRRIGRSALSSRLDLPIFGRRAYGASAARGLRDTGRNGGSRERGVRRTRTRARGARARARRGARRAGRDRPHRRRRGHRQDPARGRAREACP